MRGGDPHTKFLAPNPNLQLASFYHLDFSKKKLLTIWSFQFDPNRWWHCTVFSRRLDQTDVTRARKARDDRTDRIEPSLPRRTRPRQAGRWCIIGCWAAGTVHGPLVGAGAGTWRLATAPYSNMFTTGDDASPSRRRQAPYRARTY